MKRIDTINARENMFGVGKSGFHDNADLPGQDATYVSPEWFNAVQEELCNLLELRGITLDPASKRQLYDLLTTQADLEALADEIETNFLRKNQIVDNLTTNDATKVASARTVRDLQDNKLDKTDLKDASATQKGIVQLNNTLTSASTTEALTAAQGKALLEMFATLQGTNMGYFKIPNANNPSRPTIVQYAEIYISANYTGYTFPIAFPNACSGIVNGTGWQADGNLEVMNIIGTSKSKTGFTALATTTSTYTYIAIGY